MAVSDGDDITVVKDMGLVDHRVRRAHARRRSAATWPSATPGTPPPARARGATRSRSTGRRPHRVRPRPQRQPDQHRRAGRRGGHAPGHGSLSDSDLVAELLAPRARAGRGARRRARRSSPTEPPGAGARRRCCPARGRLLVVLWTRPRSIGVRDPNGFRPLCLGRLEQGGWVLASESPALDVVGAALRPRARARRDGHHRRRRGALGAPVPRRAARPQALPLRVRLLRPARHPPLRPRASTTPASAHGRAARRAGAGRGRHGHGRARVGHPRRRGLRPGQRHPVRPGPGEEPLHRPHLHRAQPGDAGARRAHEAQPARENIAGQAGDRGRRLHRARHHPEADRQDAARGGRHRGPPPPHVAAHQVVVLLRHRHRRARRAARRTTSTVDEIREYLNVDSSPIITLDRLDRLHRHRRHRLLRRLLHRQLPGGGPGHAPQGRARDRRCSGVCDPAPVGATTQAVRQHCSGDEAPGAGRLHRAADRHAEADA